MTDEDAFDEIVDHNFIVAEPAKPFVAPIKQHGPVKASATDGLICLILFAASVALFVWASLDVSWGQARLVGGIVVFSTLFQFSKKFGG